MPNPVPHVHFLSSYEQNKGPQKAMALEYMEEDYGDENILDLGCGGGEMTAEVASRTTGHVDGLDISEDMILYARDNHQRDKG